MTEPEQRVHVPEQRVPVQVQRVENSADCFTKHQVEKSNKKEKVKKKTNSTLPLKPNREEMERSMINVVKQTKN